VISTVILMATHLYRTHAQRDYQAQLAAAQHQAQTSELFARELAHRLKNALAIVQSIAAQTLGDDTEQAQAFAARLRALASAHDLLTDHVERPTAQVAEVIRSALRPFLNREDRVRLQCPELAISSQTVISLALLLHELGTNASKYGALSSQHGWVSLQLEDAGEAIRLSWHEHDGPEVSPIGRHGFGAKLLSRIGADPQFEFDPQGLRYTVSLRKT
jgi:two-component sensor histidine kinase